MREEKKESAHNLQGTLDRIEATGDGEDGVSLGMILQTLGARTFGPLILLAGIVILAPIIGDIPGVPTIMGVIVILAASQQIIGRKHFWLPRRILNHRLSTSKMQKAVSLMRKPSKWIDKVLSRRFTFLTTGFSIRVIGAACLLIGLALPLMELVPFSANLAGLALTLFGLGLIANDGIITAIGLAVVALIGWIVTRSLL